jgi:hypothetical protein
MINTTVFLGATKEPLIGKAQPAPDNRLELWWKELLLAGFLLNSGVVLFLVPALASNPPNTTILPCLMQGFKGLMDAFTKLPAGSHATSECQAPYLLDICGQGSNSNSDAEHFSNTDSDDASLITVELHTPQLDSRRNAASPAASRPRDCTEMAAKACGPCFTPALLLQGMPRAMAGLVSGFSPNLEIVIMIFAPMTVWLLKQRLLFKTAMSMSPTEVGSPPKYSPTALACGATRGNNISKTLTNITHQSLEVFVLNCVFVLLAFVANKTDAAAYITDKFKLDQSAAPGVQVTVLLLVLYGLSKPLGSKRLDFEGKCGKLAAVRAPEHFSA